MKYLTEEILSIIDKVNHAVANNQPGVHVTINNIQYYLNSFFPSPNHTVGATDTAKLLDVRLFEDGDCHITIKGVLITYSDKYEKIRVQTPGQYSYVSYCSARHDITYSGYFHGFHLLFDHTNTKYHIGCRHFTTIPALVHWHQVSRPSSSLSEQYTLGGRLSQNNRQARAKLMIAHINSQDTTWCTWWYHRLAANILKRLP